MSHHHTQKDLYSQDIFPFWKFPGETLAVMLERFRKEKDISPEEKLTYAGRLDPMAEGVVPVLCGMARFQKDALLGVEKEYELTVLLGVSTDTADMLGLVKEVAPVEFDEQKTIAVIQSLSTITELPYPMYSSHPAEGQPLFVHARRGTIVDIPTKKVSITAINLRSIEHTTLGDCVEATLPIIETVSGDFRQQEIMQTWKKQNQNMSVVLVNCSMTVSSGTYMRSLSEVVGKQLGVPALAYRIKRLRVGEYIKQYKK